ncbi:MAG: hypothetical protein J0L62_07095 [Bacteroidetes bacterium]|nr:hypothetical protein [Bacteroidota bacterium]
MKKLLLLTLAAGLVFGAAIAGDKNDDKKKTETKEKKKTEACCSKTKECGTEEKAKAKDDCAPAAKPAEKKAESTETKKVD